MEECAEIQKAASKALRFGLNEKHPKRDTTNEQDIISEYCDLLGIVELLEENSIIKNARDEVKIKNKKIKTTRYMMKKKFDTLRGVVSYGN
jgi:hypothetical protein